MFVIFDLSTRQTQLVTLEEAARIAQLNEVDIQWSIEEFGRCETDEHIIVEEGDTPDFELSKRLMEEAGG